MKHALLAFDGSPKATEALFLAVYLAEKWSIQLTVVSAIDDSQTKSSPITQARKYLETREIHANLTEQVGPPSDVILQTMEEQKCDFIIVGGYGYSPIVEVLLGSTLDALLRLSKKPILICH
jgi:nucleotide-binding universal stress UspA family protein